MPEALVVDRCEFLQSSVVLWRPAAPPQSSFRQRAMSRHPHPARKPSMTEPTRLLLKQNLPDLLKFRMWGNLTGPGRYVVCLRGSDSPFSPRRTYAARSDDIARGPGGLVPVIASVLGQSVCGEEW